MGSVMGRRANRLAQESFDALGKVAKKLVKKASPKFKSKAPMKGTKKVIDPLPSFSYFSDFPPPPGGYTYLNGKWVRDPLPSLAGLEK
jgi:hypothetical protein